MNTFYICSSYKNENRILMASKEEISAFLKSALPQTGCSVVDVGNSGSTLRFHITEKHLRPGGTVAGPVLMEVADVAIYVAILGELGIVALAVTTSLTINFLRKPSAEKDIIGICKILKQGKRLVVGEVSLFSDGDDEAVAHVVATYSIPPTKADV